jgi:L-lactate dehydrogenase complex protein LldG
VNARDEMLARIRAALGPAPAAPPVPRDYHRTADGAELTDLFVDRLVDYQATVVRVEEAAVPATIASHVDGPVIVPPGLAWAVPESTVDSDFTPSELDGFGTVVTACAAACAATGTIALDGSPDQGRRAISLVPDRHICVVRTDQVVATVPELLARLAPTRPITLISGPSATSDIELNRVEGVHGPRTLIVILYVQGSPAGA